MTGETARHLGDGPDHLHRHSHDHSHQHHHNGEFGHDHGHHDHGHVAGEPHVHEWELPMPAEGTVSLGGMDRFTLRTAGLDIGSATSHLTISKLVFQRMGTALSNRIVVSERTQLYRSPIMLTPFRDDGLIDVAALQSFFDGAYAESGHTADDIDAGVVIVTGEAANRPNAEPLAAHFAKRAGPFICVAAGPHYEALLAAHGSGAVALSGRAGSRVLNVDIGGGTTKLSVVVGGEVEHTGAFSVGARLIALDDDGRVVRIEPPAEWMLAHRGQDLRIGDHPDPAVLDGLAALMADLVLGVVTGVPGSGLLDRLWVTEPLDSEAFHGVDCVVFSGGVSEYVYGREEAVFGDLGPRLGAAVRTWLQDPSLGLRVVEPPQGIRATVLGAGQHSVQASGITNFVDDVLPVAGLKVVAATVADPRGLADRLRESLDRFQFGGTTIRPAFALTIEADIDYCLLRGIAEELADLADPAEPLFIILGADVAHALGRILRTEVGWAGPVVAVDQLVVGELDYVDIGRPMGEGYTVPVTVKSLTFLTRH